jgi:adenosylhomocysteine nucleosidase
MGEHAPMKILVVAADRMELAHFPKGRSEIMLLAGGVGVKAAAAAARRGIEEFRPDAMVSAGFCGALTHELEIADIVVATEVVGGQARYPALPVESSRCFHPGAVRTHVRVAQTAEERSALRATGAIAVEMEACAVAECARERNLPFYCIKTVTDLAGETMANDFNKALREDGRFDTIVLLTGTLRHPFARIPELLRLRSRCVRAARSLGDFFADCRF